MKLPLGRTCMRYFSDALAASIVCSLWLALAGYAGAADWPQWRGPNRDGISDEKGWRAENPRLLWKANVGTGCSSFSVVGEQVFTMGNRDKETGSVYCLDAKSGKILWQHSYPSALEPTYFEGGQCSTPTVDGEWVFALGRQGQLFCLNKATGAVVWSKDLLKDFSAKMAKWGYSTSPLVLGEKVLIEVGAPGASAVAFDKATGKVLWQAGDDAQSYASPYPFMQNGRQCVAFFNTFGLVVRDAADGNEVMRYPWKTQYDINAATPIVADGKIFVASGYGHGAALLPLGVADPKPIWESKAMRNQMNSCVLWQGNLYGFDDAILTCMEFATGKVKWQEKSLGKGALILADAKLIIQAEEGALAIAEASPDAYKEISRTPAVAKKTWEIPVLANGRIYTRNNTGEAACFDVSAK